MTWLGLTLIGVLALLPLLWGLRKRVAATPSKDLVDERASALALYRGQLEELARDRALGLVAPEEFESARIEVQRRLLAADRIGTSALAGSGRGRIATVILLIPVGALGLYLVNGHPTLPPQPGRQGTAESVDPKMAALLDRLQGAVQHMTPADPAYAQGHALLGQVEEARGQTDAAVRDYHLALAAKFEPVLALRVAELQRANEGRISADTLSLYRRALDAAPKDAPWRMDVEARIAQGEHDLGEQNPTK
ncbi:c-type cytochrome biogenesis protein CcmI [Acidomonas methanolica]|uniref:Cytochrome c-type biogenesis protein CcmH/CycH n=1 Tax=Acidomonas methanolica NBRC 104435 TaxID=1231351 RepID=A0A023D2R4_ACIMT|nr:c-type cytochrome biogenesis protein CcmI [Acidomonas methanolica]TCS27422.1 cytochrome c-type biogenesis protein CcmH [Acidomonas methanolica]GAJ28096.1 cytochrome c-type biogenesis protein CcmH/CycH [Acidomonas methanolica NBRC 104435]GBQ47293.1 cytochrome c-type biogenesis protein CycH [Acidomonas methanolica]GEK98670.1 hypothetical protein AME01nite_11690 [Acidomonas methanolica NBRC 104435]